MQSLTLYYWLPFALAWAGLTWLLIRRVAVSPRAIVMVALAARLVVLFASPPVLSDDIWRYIHDGRTVGGGEHPYEHAPAEIDADARINHPHLVTIYQPSSQYVFASQAMAAELTGVRADIVFRLGFVALDMMVVLLLLRALRDRGRPAWWACLYAWHPLAISEVASSGHQEPLGIALLLASLLLAERSRVTIGRAALAGVAFAAAVAVKPLVAPLCVALAWSLRDRRAALAAATCAAAAMGAALYLPFALTGPGLARMRETVETFMGHWAFNSSIHGLLSHTLLTKPAADRVCMIALLGVLGWCVWKGWQPTRTAMVYLFAALLLSSTVHPWYMLWALAFVPLHFNAALWVWSLTIAASYAVLRDRAAWSLPVWLIWCEYVPVYLLLAFRRLRLGD